MKPVLTPTYIIVQHGKTHSIARRMIGLSSQFVHVAKCESLATAEQVCAALNAQERASEETNVQPPATTGSKVSPLKKRGV